MPLNVKIECDGETHVIAVSAIEDEYGDYELTAEIMHPGHDYSYDVGAHEFGYALPRCYEIQEHFEEGFHKIFMMAEEVLSQFLQALAKEGAEALGMDREDFARVVIDFIEEDRLEGGRLLTEILIDLPWFKGTAVFRDEAHGLAKLAYDNDDAGFFYIINKLYGGGLIKVEEEEDEEIGEYGQGRRVQGATIKVFIGDTLVDEWSFGFVGWFCDISLYDSNSWHVERMGGSGSASSTTDDFLRSAGFAGRSGGIEEPYKPERPELPRCFCSGDWALMHDEYCFECFKTEDDVYWAYEATRDGSMSGRGMFDVILTILHRVKSLDKSEHTGERWGNSDPNDETIWEIVESAAV